MIKSISFCQGKNGVFCFFFVVGLQGHRAVRGCPPPRKPYYTARGIRNLQGDLDIICAMFGYIIQVTFCLSRSVTSAWVLPNSLGGNALVLDFNYRSATLVLRDNHKRRCFIHLLQRRGNPKPVALHGAVVPHKKYTIAVRYEGSQYKADMGRDGDLRYTMSGNENSKNSASCDISWLCRIDDSDYMIKM